MSTFINVPFISNMFGSLYVGNLNLNLTLLSADKVKLSQDVEKPTSAHLGSLPPLPTTDIVDNYVNIPDQFRWAKPANTTDLVYNCHEGVKIGTTASGNAVWAHIEVRSNQVVCDNPHRAFVFFQALEGTTAKALASLDEVVHWSAALAQCENTVTRWAYIYDALVQETQFEVGT